MNVTSEEKIMTIKSISIIGGRGRTCPEFITRIGFKMGDVVSVVGPTGSGKTMLINDLELLADGTTPSQRKILINDEEPSDSLQG